MGSRRARQEAQAEEEEEEMGDHRRKVRAVKHGRSRHPKGQKKNK